MCSDKCCKYTPPEAHSDTGDTVYNITLRDYTDYLLRTTKEFRKRRYITWFLMWANSSHSFIRCIIMHCILYCIPWYCIVTILHCTALHLIYNFNIRYGGVTFGHKIEDVPVRIRNNKEVRVRRLIATEGIKVCNH